MSRIIHFECGRLENHRPDPGIALFAVRYPCPAKWILRDGSERNLFMAAGYIHDGMSIPLVGQKVTGLNPESYPKGVVPHEILYRTEGGRNPDAFHGCTLTNHNGNDVLVSRAEADDLLCFVMRIEGACLWKRAWVRSITFGLGALYWGGPSPCFKQ